MSQNSDGDELIADLFDKILGKLKTLLPCRFNRQTFFIIYAHDNDQKRDQNGQTIPAHAAIVKKYIQWFKDLNLNVLSDRSAHGWKNGHNIDHASTDIIANQRSILPKEWDSKSAHRVIVFGSHLLGQYLRDESRIKAKDGRTFIEAVEAMCKKRADLLEELGHSISSKTPRYRQRKQKWLDETEKELRLIQETYQERLGPEFHHVLTEMGLLRYRSQCRKSNYIIPMLLGCELDDSGLGENLAYKNTNVRVLIDIRDAYGRYRSFFKLIKMFEELLRYQQILELLESCFNECVKFYQENPNLRPAEYKETFGSKIGETMINMTYLPCEKDNGRVIEEIRTILTEKYCNDYYSSEIDGKGLAPRYWQDIDLVFSKDHRPGCNSHTENHNVTIGNILEGTIGVGPETHRILIRGPAGIGKTALSKLIAYKCHEDKNLRVDYDFALRITFRHLRRAETLLDFLHKEFFSTHDIDFPKSLLNLMKSQPDKILFILDGVDELPSDCLKEEVVQEFTKQTNVIVFSRHDVKQTHIETDVEIKALGLSETSIQQHLTNLSEEGATKEAEEIRSFIADNQVLNLVQTPIHLDIMCRNWSQLHLLTDKELPAQNLTVTKFYQSTMNGLWRHDFEKFEIWRGQTKLSPEELRRIYDEGERLELLAGQIALLGRLAITLMGKTEQKFFEEDVDTAYDEIELETTKCQLLHRLKCNLGKTSFLHTDNNGGQLCYSFRHSTFLEFFAAVHLATHWDELRKVLREYKYNRRYENVWRFVAGLWGKLPGDFVRFFENLTKPPQLEDFFDELQKEPLDLSGKQQAHLITNCFNECRYDLRTPLRNEIQQNLKKWFEFELEYDLFKGSNRIWNLPSFPEDILVRKFEKKVLSPELKRLLLRIKRTNLSKEFCNLLLEMPEWACDKYFPIIASQSSLAPCVIQKLERLRDSPHPKVRSHALFILQRHGLLPEDGEVDLIRQFLETGLSTTLASIQFRSNKALLCLVEHIGSDYDLEAIITLEAQTSLSKEITKPLIEALFKHMDHPTSFSYDYLVKKIEPDPKQYSAKLGEFLNDHHKRGAHKVLIARCFKQCFGFDDVIFDWLQENLDDKRQSGDSDRDEILSYAFQYICDDIPLSRPEIYPAVAQFLNHENFSLSAGASLVLLTCTEGSWKDKVTSSVFEQVANLHQRNPIITQALFSERQVFSSAWVDDGHAEKISITTQNFTHLLSHKDSSKVPEHLWQTFQSLLIRGRVAEIAGVFRFQKNLDSEVLEGLMDIVKSSQDPKNALIALKGRAKAVSLLLQHLCSKSCTESTAWMIFETLEECTTFPPEVVEQLTQITSTDHPQHVTWIAAKLLRARDKGEIFGFAIERWLQENAKDFDYSYLLKCHCCVDNFNQYSGSCFICGTGGTVDNTNASPMWILDNCLYWHAADGSKKTYKLGNEQAFRDRLYKIQDRVKLPTWCHITVKEVAPPVPAQPIPVTPLPQPPIAPKKPPLHKRFSSLWRSESSPGIKSYG